MRGRRRGAAADVRLRELKQEGPGGGGPTPLAPVARLISHTEVCREEEKKKKTPYHATNESIKRLRLLVQVRQGLKMVPALPLERTGLNWF